MLRVFKGFLFIALLFIAISACKNMPNPKKTTKTLPHLVNYYVRYLEDEQIVKAKATFRLAEDPASQKGVEVVGDVFFNNKKLTADNIPGIGLHYPYQAKERIDSIQTFDIQYSNGTKIKHSATAPAIDSFWIEAAISLKNGFHLAWKGTPLAETETLVLLLTDSKGQTTPMNRVGGSPTSRIEIIPPQLEKVAKGKGTLALVRKKNLVVKEEDIKIGTFLMEYYTREIEVDISE